MLRSSVPCVQQWGLRPDGSVFMEGYEDVCKTKPFLLSDKVSSRDPKNICFCFMYITLNAVLTDPGRILLPLWLGSGCCCSVHLGQ